MIHGPYNIMSKGLVWGKQYTEASSEMQTKHKKFKGRINSGDLNINGGVFFRSQKSKAWALTYVMIAN